MIRDFIIIGGGIAGASASYFLKLKKYNITLFESECLGYGGSGAAGAFLNPKVGKSGELAQLTNSAIDFAIQLYLKDFPEYIHKSTLNHINDGQTIKVDGAVADAHEILKSFTKDIDINFSKVSEIKFDGEFWRVGDEIGKNLILTTGAYPQLIDELYLNIRPVWGERLDITTNRVLNESYHKDISVSQTVDGVVRVGATHFREVLQRDGLDRERLELLREAQSFVELPNSKIIKSYSGVRSASRDYFPIIGRVVDSRETVKRFPQLKNGRKYLAEDYIYYKNLYIFTGLGGYGFSLAPYLADRFVKNLTSGEMFSKNLEPHRFFSRWVKK